jgi:GT2 family glycosyltransferase
MDIPNEQAVRRDDVVSAAEAASEATNPAARDKRDSASAARIAELEARLRDALSEGEAVPSLRWRVTELEAELSAVRDSYSWRATAPLRNVARVLGILPAIRDVLARQAQVQGGYGRALAYYGGLIHREGPRGLVRRVKRLADGGEFAESPIPDHVYRAWIKEYDTIDDADRETIAVEIEKLAHWPLISVLVPTYNSDERLLRQMIDSVSAQIYPHWELCIADDASSDERVRQILAEAAARDSRIKTVFRKTNGHISAASNSALELVSGEYVALLDHDDVLPPHALYMVARYINLHPRARMFYSDEDKLTLDGERTTPQFKCDWNPLLFLTRNVFSHLGIFETALVREVGGFRMGYEGSQDYDLALRCVERCGNDCVVHIPHVLYHWRVVPGSTAGSASEKPYALVAAERAVADHLRRSNIEASVEVSQNGLQLIRVRYALPQPQPLVSIIIPARDSVRLTRQCIESIFKRTLYRNYEIVVVDNGSVESETLAYFDEISQRHGVRVLRDDAPFNFSALNNRAVRDARGEYLCLLNNDVEVISPDWLSEMVSLAAQPGNGAVGARLWYPNDTVQHAGVLLGLGGVAGHVNLGARRGQAGYFARAVVSQNMTVVTAACLVVRKLAWERVGGMNEELAIAYNDVDFCLRLAEAGYRNVWTPHAELYHHESASRGSDMAPEKRARFVTEARWMQARWGTMLDRDPAYNRNLTLDTSQPFFSLASPPRIGKLE